MGGYGLLGGSLSHSYSPQIHRLLGDTPYDLYERTPEELADFLQTGGLAGVNVTIPYKKTVMPFCGSLSENARRIGSVNTLIRQPDGTLRGENTDYDGFAFLFSHSGISPRGKRALVLGSGGASLTVQTVLRDQNARSVTVISRQGPDNYGNLERHRDAELIVNTTPVGMFPGNGASPVDLRQFPQCQGVVDLIYNPARTELLLQAEELGIPTANGLPMLVAQAASSAALFLGVPQETEKTLAVLDTLQRQTENLILVGMPGCGKSTLGRKLAEETGRPFRDADLEVARQAGRSIGAIFAAEGERGFRRRETEVLRQLGKQTGVVIATGGGCVTRPENRKLLRQNGRIVWIRRQRALLPTEGRPLSTEIGLAALEEQRLPLYRSFADLELDNNGTPEAALHALKEVIR